MAKRATSRRRRCLMCFAERPVDGYLATGIELCRGCKYQVDKLIGFWETQGFGLQLTAFQETGQEELWAGIDPDADPESKNPPKAPPSKRKRAKSNVEQLRTDVEVVLSPETP